MTAAAYIDAIKSMQGLLPEMIESLIAMAEKMSDQQREDAIKELTPVNAEILAAQEELDRNQATQDKKLQAFKKQRLPAFKQAIAQAEETQAEATLSGEIDNL